MGVEIQMNELQLILEEIGSVINRVDQEELTHFIKTIQSGKRIFVVGEGRSGLMAKSFAMRLMHLGASVYVVGETITPSIEKDDILVAVSGSGTTKSILFFAQKASELGCKVAALTTNPESELAN